MVCIILKCLLKNNYKKKYFKNLLRNIKKIIKKVLVWKPLIYTTSIIRYLLLRGYFLLNRSDRTPLLLLR